MKIPAKFVLDKIKSIIKYLKSHKHTNQLITIFENWYEVSATRWIQFSTREKQLLIVSFVVIGIFIFISIIDASVGFLHNINQRYIVLQNSTSVAQALKVEYKTLLTINNNEFNTVDLAKIQGDVKNALNIDNSEITFQDNMLIIVAKNVSLQATILLLEQLRKSYGIFPDKVKFIKTSPSYVNLNATFTVSKQ